VAGLARSIRSQRQTTEPKMSENVPEVPEIMTQLTIAELQEAKKAKAQTAPKAEIKPHVETAKKATVKTGEPIVQPAVNKESLAPVKQPETKPAITDDKPRPVEPVVQVAPKPAPTRARSVDGARKKAAVQEEPIDEADVDQLRRRLQQLRRDLVKVCCH